MATSCPVCGERLSRKAGVCDVCGEPIRATSSAPVSALLAPTASLQRAAAEGGAGLAGPDQPAVSQRGATGRSRRLLVLSCLVVVGLALSATYAALRSTPQDRPDGSAYGLVRLSSDPGLRWQHPMAQIAPELGCPTAATDRPRADSCLVTASATVQDIVVVSVQRSQQSELIGLSRADGAVSWHRRAPAGSTYTCMVTGGRLWCLTVR